MRVLGFHHARALAAVCIFSLSSPPTVTVRGVFLTANQKQYIMKILKKILKTRKEELRDSALGAISVWVIIALMWLTLKIFC